MDPIKAPRGPVRPRFEGPGTNQRRLALLGVVMLAAGCGGNQATAGPSAGVTAPALTFPTGPSLTPTEPAVTTGAPSITPSEPAPTATVTEGFHYSDILKVRVNSLAVRIAPKRTAALVHGYDLSGPAPVDAGTVRLDKGDFVSVQLGPVPIGDTVWYLVWPATATTLHPSGVEWYTSPPPDASPVAAWVAASVGDAKYLTLERRPDVAEIEAYMPVGLNVAGRGNYESAPLARHDAFLIDWVAASTVSGSSCKFTLAFAPSDADFEPEVIIDATTTSVKMSSLNGFGASVPWLPIPAGAWDTFTVTVTSTCNWAIRLVRLEHD